MFYFADFDAFCRKVAACDSKSCLRNGLTAVAKGYLQGSREQFRKKCLFCWQAPINMLLLSFQVIVMV